MLLQGLRGTWKCSQRLLAALNMPTQGKETCPTTKRSDQLPGNPFHFYFRRQILSFYCTTNSEFPLTNIMQRKELIRKSLLFALIILSEYIRTCFNTLTDDSLKKV